MAGIDTERKAGISTRTVLILAIVLCGFYWLGTWQTSLFDRDEPRFAQPAREMLSGSGWRNWMVPRFNGEPFFHKPPLAYWQMAGAFAVFGVGEFSARFFSGLWTAASGILILGYLARRVSLLAGLVGMMAFSTSLMVVVEAKLATADATLNLLVLLAVFSLWEIHGGRATVPVRLILWVSAGIGILCKGPAIFLVLVGLVLALSIFERNVRWLNRTGWAWGLPLALAIGLPWYWLANHLSGGELVERFVQYDLLARVQRPLESHRGFPGFYVLTGLLDTWPWSAFLAPVAVYAWRNRQDGNIRFLLAWLIGPTILLEMIRTKMVHYWLIVLPAYVILLALAVASWWDDPGARFWRRWNWPVLLTIGVVWLAIGAGVGAMVWLARAHDVFRAYGLNETALAVLATLVLGTMIVSSGLAFFAGRRGDLGSAVVGTAMGAILVAAGASVFALPLLEPFKLGRGLADALNGLGNNRTTYVLIGWQEPSTTFYLHSGERPVVYADADQFWTWATRRDTVVAVSDKYAGPLLADSRSWIDRKLELRVYQGRDFTRGGRVRTFYIARSADEPAPR